MRRLALTCSFAGLLTLALGAVDARAQGPGRDGPGGPGGPGFRMSPLMAALDTDGDGELSAREIDNASARLKSLDRDKDGKLSAEELRPAGGPGGMGGPGGRGGPGMGMGGGGNASQMVATMLTYDKDGDGKLSKSELPQRLQNLMASADTNKDGFLDRAEMTKFAESRAGGRGGPGGPGGGRGGRGGPGENDGPPRDN